MQLDVTPNGSRLIIGGAFTNVGGFTRYANSFANLIEEAVQVTTG